jgi:peptidoglycan hydrolase-like protein with peptidoglycan-binding domain
LLLRGGEFSFNSASQPSPEQLGHTSSALKIKTYKVPPDHQVQRAAGQKPSPTENAASRVAVVDDNAGGPMSGALSRQSAPLIDSRASKDPLPRAVGGSTVDLVKLMGVLDPLLSRKNAAAVLISLWNQSRMDVDLIPEEVEDDDFFNIVAHQHGLRRYMVNGDWELVKNIDLPAIVALQAPMDNAVVYLALVGWTDGRLQLVNPINGTFFEVEFEYVKPYMEGPVHIYWKNITGFDMIVRYGTDERAILMIKGLLRKVGYVQLSDAPVFDVDTEVAIRSFQAQHNLKIDGLVGPLTKMVLLREAGTAVMPQLSIDPRAES